ncbi:MAG: tetratricopeptide repeat protein [Bacteroidales bacterium]
MAKNKKKKDQGEENLVAVEEALSKTENFIEKNKNILLYTVIGIAVLVLAIMGYQRYILLPKEQNAHKEMFRAELYFQQDSFNLALNGDGSYLGFLDIMEEYKNTKSANLAHFYAGVSYLKLENYDKAIDYLKGFKSKDEMIKPMALGNLGNAYMEKGELEKALKHYEKAAEASDNEFTSAYHMLRAGMTYELMEKYDQALETYQSIEKEYPKSPFARDIKKYIARAEASKS